MPGYIHMQANVQRSTNDRLPSPAPGMHNELCLAYPTVCPEERPMTGPYNCHVIATFLFAGSWATMTRQAITGYIAAVH